MSNEIDTLNMQIELLRQRSYYALKITNKKSK